VDQLEKLKMDTNNLETFALPEAQQKTGINWSRIPPHEMQIILAIAGRGLQMLMDIAARRGAKHLHPEMQSNAQQFAMDVGIAHLHRGLDLLRFFESAPDDFLKDFVDIILNVSRIDGTIPDFVYLRCANPALKPTKET
jgi:hypothetical protein